MLATILLLLNGLFILVLLFSSRSRKKNEPPLDKGLIPWLGHALEFGKDPAKFLTRMKQKHGDIFTVCVAGHYVTVLLDPNSFDSVLNDTDCLDFAPIRGKLIKKIFCLPSIMPTSERRWLEKHFHGPNLQRLSSSMNAHLRSLLLNDPHIRNPSGWTDGLFSFCYSLLFRAGYLTLFESKDSVAVIYEEFRKFDHFLTKLARGTLKRVESKIVNTSRSQLWKLLSRKGLDRRSESPSWQQSYYEFLQKEGIDAEMQEKALLLQLWTTQCNAGPAAFWVLGFLLTHPAAMEALQSEIRSLSALQNTSLQLPLTHALEAHSTPVFDSILSETLRLTAAVMINREVVCEKTLHMANGKVYRLRRGDRVCIFPYVSPQMDPQIHQEPQMFKYDRFLKEDNTMKDKFYKDGKEVKYYNMLWGGGKSTCIGKEFAVKAIKQFVFLLLAHLDVELCNPEAKLPPVNPSRHGFGMLQPDGDLQVRFKLKNI